MPSNGAVDFVVLNIAIPISGDALRGVLLERGDDTPLNQMSEDEIEDLATGIALKGFAVPLEDRDQPSYWAYVRKFSSAVEIHRSPFKVKATKYVAADFLPEEFQTAEDKAKFLYPTNNA